MQIDTQFDRQKNYCRKLGHFLTFEYCRKEEFDHPCRSIRNCWMHKFDIDQFLQNNFSEKDIGYLSALSPPKMSHIIELISAAQQNSDAV